MRNLLLTVALGLLVLPACDDGEACTLDLRPSVVIDVADAETGEPVSTAVITFTVDGGSEEMSDSLQPKDGKYVVAHEQDGHFAVTVEADGYEPALVEYDVGSDDCHVVTVHDTVELTPTP